MNSAACERNKQPIFKVLTNYLKGGDNVLEIGSGTGQHALYFAEQRPDITWQCSDQASYLADLIPAINSAGLKNSPKPFELDVNTYDWNKLSFDVVFTANTLHIMSWPTVENFLSNVHLSLTKKGFLIIYGPFKINGEFTSESNQCFDIQLKTHDPQRGIRDLEQVNSILTSYEFKTIANHPMPANNNLLVWCC